MDKKYTAKKNTGLVKFWTGKCWKRIYLVQEFHGPEKSGLFFVDKRKKWISVLPTENSPEKYSPLMEGGVLDKNGLKGKILIGVTGGVAIGLSILTVPFLTPALRKFCIPYVPATKTQIGNILKALKNRKGNVLDLGSGDGRIVFEVAKKLNLNADGVELNAVLVGFSKLCALKYGLWNKTKFYRRNFWQFNVSNYENIIIFGVDGIIMEQLEQKFQKECTNQKGCNVIACRFPLPNCLPIQKIGHGIDTVWIYKFT